VVQPVAQSFDKDYFNKTVSMYDISFDVLYKKLPYVCMYVLSLVKNRMTVGKTFRIYDSAAPKDRDDNMITCTIYLQGE